MKRSELNRIIGKTIRFMEEEKGLPMPSFAHWGPEDWKKAGEDYQELVDNMLGWDISDFGSGDFKKIGLTIFTYRNGNFHNKEKYPKPYAEKLLLVDDGQILPYHYHWSKMEDIINKGGGDLVITLYNATKEDFEDVEGGRSGKKGTFDTTPVTVSVDGHTVTVPAGGQVTLKPGESITLKPGQYHSWQGVPGTGPVMLFEVSTTNDDTIDNRFHTAGERIPEIIEDEEPKYLIFADYKDYYGNK